MTAKDRTVASAYSVRPTPDARGSAPFEWAELPSIELQDFIVSTVPARFARSDPRALIVTVAHSLESLLELSDADEARGLVDAPWPPHHAKQRSEPPRAPPSRRCPR